MISVLNIDTRFTSLKAELVDEAQLNRAIAENLAMVEI